MKNNTVKLQNIQKFVKIMLDRINICWLAKKFFEKIAKKIPFRVHWVYAERL